MACVAWWVHHHRQALQQGKPRIWYFGMCCLAARCLPLGGSLWEPRNTHEQHESPGSSSSPARQFLEKFQKHEFSQHEHYIGIQLNMLFIQNNDIA